VSTTGLVSLVIATNVTLVYAKPAIQAEDSGVHKGLCFQNCTNRVWKSTRVDKLLLSSQDPDRWSKLDNRPFHIYELMTADARITPMVYDAHGMMFSFSEMLILFTRNNLSTEHS